MSARSRFNDKWIEDYGGCWIWVAAQNSQGYGILRVQQRSWLAHRFSWFMANGDIPDGHFICHKCDTPLCVNPEHLFVGTPQENTLDSVAKGRWGDRAGQMNSQSKLDDEMAMAIFMDGATHRSIADRFGVTKATVGKIKRKKLWTHIHA